MEDVNISKYRASVVREGSKPASPGFVVSEGQSPTDPAGTGQNHLPVTIAAASTGLSITESQILSGAGTVSQYIRGDGSLADFPEASGGGSSISYYLNGSINQGTIGGVAYKELNKVPILGAGTDFSINADGYIASFLTDAGDPNLLEIPGGNWNFETYFSSSSSGGTPTFYVELYKYDGTTFTLIASNSSAPEFIAFGTTLTAYFSTLAVPTTTLALTDRLAVRYYVTHSGRTITLHTENNHLCQIITTFTTGLTALNGLTAQVQNFAVGTSGTDFAIASATATHTFNLPTASATNRGALSSADWTTFNGKQNALTNPVTGTGTNNYLPKFTGLTTIGDSVIADNTNEVNISKRIFLNSGGQSIFFTPNLSGVSNRIEGSSGIPLEIFTGGSALRLGAGGSSTQINLASTGVVTMSNLAGTGSRIVVADSSGNLSASSALSGYVQGSGTTNYLPKFTAASTIGNSQMFDNGTNVGIGTASPSYKLSVVGPNGGNAISWTDNINNTGFLGIRGGGVASIGADNNLVFETGAVERMRITSGGNLLVGTTSDNGARLQVSGSSYFSQQVNIPNNIDIAFGTNTGNYIGQYYNGTDLLFYNGTGGASFFGINRGTGAATFSSSVTANVGSLSGSFGLNVNVNSTFAFGSTNGRRTGTITRDSGDKPGLQFGYDATDNTGILAGATESLGAGLDFYTYNGSSWGNRMRITSGGNVGIGTASPIFGAFSRLTVGNSSSDGGITIQSSSTGISRLFFAKDDSSNVEGLIRYPHSTNQMQFWTAATQQMTITSSGNVLIGTTTDGGAKFQLRQTGVAWASIFNHTNATTQFYMDIQYNGSQIGSIMGNNTAASFNTSSDYRLKTDLKDYNGLDLVSKIKTYDFAWKTDKSRSFGVIAHELQQVINYAVTGRKDGEFIQGVDYSKLVPIMVKAIQELKQEIDTLKN